MPSKYFFIIIFVLNSQCITFGKENSNDTASSNNELSDLQLNKTDEVVVGRDQSARKNDSDKKSFNNFFSNVNFTQWNFTMYTRRPSMRKPIVFSSEESEERFYMRPVKKPIDADLQGPLCGPDEVMYDGRCLNGKFGLKKK